jgi:Ca2+-binding RTX toxin-like protein
MTPDRENRLKTMTVLFAAVVSLFLVRGGHATVQGIAPCTITGTPDADILVGTKGRDVICGLGGNDVLDGNGGDRGSDRVYGGLGNDVIFAWDGFADKLDGGPGKDHAWKDMLDRSVRIERYG